MSEVGGFKVPVAKMIVYKPRIDSQKVNEARARAGFSYREQDQSTCHFTGSKFNLLLRGFLLTANIVP